MKLGLPISTIGHAAVLIWALVSFSAKTFDASSDSMLIDVVSTTEFSKLTAGSEKATKAAPPKPIVDKVADEPKPTQDPTPKVSEKPPIEATAEEAPPPPEAAPESKESKAAPSVDAIAEALQKDQAKQLEEQKRLEEQKKVEEQKRREEAKRRAEAKRIEEAKRREESKKLEQRITELLDKRDPRREAATGTVVNSTANLGTASPKATAPTLSIGEMDALRAKLNSKWTIFNNCVVHVRIQLGLDKRLVAPPEVVSSNGPAPQCQIAADSAKRAVLDAQPFEMLLPSTYDAWRDLEINFDPIEMRRG
jgi:hypothetical protein